jgi:glutathione S-transferase
MRGWTIIDITDQKMEQSQLVSSSASESRGSKAEQRIVIGYYNLRGKAQVCRLLC